MTPTSPKICAGQDAACCSLLRTDEERHRLTDVDNCFLIVFGHNARRRKDIDLRVLRQSVKHCVQFAGDDAVFQTENLFSQSKIGRSLPADRVLSLRVCALFPHPLHPKRAIVIERYLNNLCFDEDLGEQHIKLFDQFFNGGKISDERSN